MPFLVLRAGLAKDLIKILTDAKQVVRPSCRRSPSSAAAAEAVAVEDAAAVATAAGAAVEVAAADTVADTAAAEVVGTAVGMAVAARGGERYVGEAEAEGRGVVVWPSLGRLCACV